ncbi:hypothetical protein Nepgr_022609 [Nepenthes gracilis]|uniref:Uncharacterized protein n=1 Tax=Nepenthes gracilis TaxID=150966 RepID=A0AAD3T190_NEPGR|nr:hypothetical protein Nepgr_022609 [Nepenthes gracilis]
MLEKKFGVNFWRKNPEKFPKCREFGEDSGLPVPIPGDPYLTEPRFEGLVELALDIGFIGVSASDPDVGVCGGRRGGIGFWESEIDGVSETKNREEERNVE